MLCDKLESAVREFETYLIEEKKMSENTIEAYQRDIRGFCRFTQERGVEYPEDASNAEVVAYLMRLKQEGKAKATVNRKLAAIRTWFQYLVEEGRVSRNPAI